MTSQLDWLHALAIQKHTVCHLYQVAILECISAFIVLHFNVIVCWSSNYSQLAKEALKYQRCPRRMLIMLMVCFSYTVTLYMASVYLYTRLPIIGSSWWKALILLRVTLGGDNVVIDQGRIVLVLHAMALYSLVTGKTIWALFVTWYGLVFLIE